MQLPTFRECLKEDLKRINVFSFKDFLKTYLFPRGETIRWLCWFRIAQYARRGRLSRMTLGVLSYPILRHYEYKFGIHANPNIPIGKGLRVVHGEAIFINCVSVGDNATIYPSVMLGEGKGGQVPTLMDNVTVCTGSVCIGGITLGEGCTIGANCFISKDVAPGATMVGVEAHALEK